MTNPSADVTCTKDRPWDGKPLTARAHRRVGVIVDLAPLDSRRPVVEQPGQRPDESGLALAALAEQDHVVTRDDRALQVRQHGLAEADDAGKRVPTGAHRLEEVVPQLLLDGAKLVPAGPELSQRADIRRGRCG